jgi:predicted NBD/HSP70 family sugar kinase/mannose-6-phosphate isomerase class I
MFKHIDIKPLTFALGVDIGGTHVSSALVNTVDDTIVAGSWSQKMIEPHQPASAIIAAWVQSIHTSLSVINGRSPTGNWQSLTDGGHSLTGIGIAMPGPFDYENGISLIRGVNKFESLYGVNIRELFRSQLDLDCPLYFENDAACFGLGECRTGGAGGFEKVIAITLGTGFGASFIDRNVPVKNGQGVPSGGSLYQLDFKDGIAEDYISSKWLLQNFNGHAGNAAGNDTVENIKQLADLALTKDNTIARETFRTFGEHLGLFLSPRIKDFKADCLVLGGNIAKSASLFLPAMSAAFAANKIEVAIKISSGPEQSAIVGAASIITKQEKTTPSPPWRKSHQPLMPAQIPTQSAPATYSIYPSEPLGSGKIFSGYDYLARWIAGRKKVLIDGYAGNDWTAIRQHLAAAFRQLQVNVWWCETDAFIRPQQEIEAKVSPFLGVPGSVWGKKTTLTLEDFYRVDDIEKTAPATDEFISIFFGIGAAFSTWDAPVVYIDLPRNEIQYRMRAGSATNLGKPLARGRALSLSTASGSAASAPSPSEMYKRCYFVDWVVLNQHRRRIKDRIEVMADGQWRDQLNWALMQTITKGLREIGRNVIRVRPWFEPGVWGGQWMKRHIPSLNQHELNYAWSFELIVPENGLVFDGDGHLLEIAFEWLMEFDNKAVLGMHAELFSTEFPIRFDFLDTFDGGNLSIQCHPSLPYIREHFGETITQDETYYILDCKDNAGIYLGFQEDIDPSRFKEELEQSHAENLGIDIDKYVRYHPAKKHDFFLIPNRTIHGAGMNNLVLEISATPYIFTFKMYDWVRLDLEGLARPINIEHAFNNLDFERKGAKVEKELLAQPVLLRATDEERWEHLPTHPEHFYDVHRVTFLNSTKIPTEGRCHILMLVGGGSIRVNTRQGRTYRFNYAETFVIPAAAEEYELVNTGDGRATVIKAFIK